MSNSSIPSKLSRRAGIARVARVARLPRITLETEQPEQPEHPSTRARAAHGGGLWFGARIARNAHELTRAQNGFLMQWSGFPCFVF
jgi:hypothetical protein